MKHLFLFLLFIFTFASCNKKTKNHKNPDQPSAKKLKTDSKKQNNVVKTRIETPVFPKIKIPSKASLSIVYVSSVHGRFSEKGCNAGSGTPAFQKFMKSKEITGMLKFVSGNSLFRKRNKYEKNPAISEKEKISAQDFIKLSASIPVDVFALGSDDFSAGKNWLKQQIKSSHLPVIAGNTDLSLPAWKMLEHNGFKIAVTVFAGKGAKYTPQTDVFNFWKKVLPEIQKSDPSIIIALVSGNIRFLKSLEKLKNPPDIYISDGSQVSNGKPFGKSLLVGAPYNLKAAGILKLYPGKNFKRGMKIFAFGRIAELKEKWHRLSKGKIRIDGLLSSADEKKFKAYKRRLFLINKQLNEIKNELSNFRISPETSVLVHEIKPMK